MSKNHKYTPVSSPAFDPGHHGKVENRTYIYPQGGTYERKDLRVKGHDTLNSGQEVMFYYVPFKHNAAGLGLKQGRDLNDGLLSYDIQIKMATGPEVRYASMGVMLRARREGKGKNEYYAGYGISIMRYNWPNSSPRDHIPESLKATNETGNHLDDKMLLTLWKQIDQNSWQWLAYKVLHTKDTYSGCSPPRYDCFVTGGQYDGDGFFIHDDTTMMVRMVEKRVSGNRTNDIQVFFGDARWLRDDQQGRTRDKNAYNVEDKRFGYEQRLAPSGEDELWKWPSLPDISSTNWNATKNDWFTAITWDRVNDESGAELRTDEEGKNSTIRDDSYTTENFKNNQNKYPEIVLNTFGHTNDNVGRSRGRGRGPGRGKGRGRSRGRGSGPIYFRDLAVRLLQGGSGSSDATMPALQQ